MKRICAIILCMVLLLSVCPVIHAAAGITEDSLEASAFFHGVGIAEEYAVITDNGTMTRKEFADFAVKVMGLDGLFNKTEGKFTDVLPEDPYAASIYTAVEIGIFNGTGADTFGGDEIITMNQAIKGAINMLGYTKKAEALGGYPYGYNKVAQQIGILNGLDGDFEAEASRSQLLTLMYQTIRTEAAYISTISPNGEVRYVTQTGKTLLSENHKIYEKEALVTADYVTAIRGTTTQDPDELVLEDELRVTCRDGARMDLVGRNIIGYYQETDRGYVLLYAETEEITEITFETGNGVTYHYESNTYSIQTDGKSVGLRVDMYADIVYNGSPLETSSKEAMEPENGRVTLIDNDRDGAYDVVLIEDFIEARVETVDAYYQMITLKKSPYMTDADCKLKMDDSLIPIRDGKIILAKEINPGNVLMVMKNQNGKTKVLVSNKSISGLVEHVKDDSIIIDGVSYEISKHGYVTKNDITAGNVYEFFLNEDNRVSYMEADQSMKTGYIVAMSAVSGFGNAEIKILDESGTVITCPIKSNVVLETYAGGRERMSVAKAKERLEKEKGLVMYQIDGNGELAKVTLPYVVSTRDEYENQPAYPILRLEYLVKNWPAASTGTAYEAEFNSYQNDMNNWVILSTSAKVFQVAAEGSTLPDKDLQVVAISEVLDGTRYIVNPDGSESDNSVEFYSYGGTPMVDLMVRYSSSDAAAEDISPDLTISNYALVQGIEATYDEDGDLVQKVSLLDYNRGNVSVELMREEVLTRESFAAQTVSGMTSVYADAAVNPQKTGVEEGDVIMYTAGGAKNAIKSLALLYDAANEVQCYQDLAQRGRVYSQFCGTVQRRVGNVVEIANNTGYFERLNLNSEVWIFDKSDNSCKIGTAKDISVGDVAVTYHHYYRYRKTIVYKDDWRDRS